MAASAERQMNLAALQQRDPYITGIVDTASQVALYSFSAKSNEWVSVFMLRVEGGLQINVPCGTRDLLNHRVHCQTVYRLVLATVGLKFI